VQRHRYKLSFLLTLFLYALLLGGFIYLKNREVAIPPHADVHKITLSLEAFVPPPPPPLHEPLLPDPVAKPILHEVKVPNIPPEIKEIPVLKPKPKKRPRKIRKKRVHKHIQKRVVTPEHTTPLPALRNTVQPVHEAPPKTSAVSPAARNRFFAALRAKINRAKRYPRMAQKRHIQGIVDVSFTIAADGTLQNLSVTGPKVFHTSAKKAVQRAFPLKTTGVPVRFPINVRLKLRYRLH